MKPLVAGQSTGWWLERLREAGIPCGEVRSVGAALGSPEAIARDMVATIPHPTAGEVSLIASPLKLGGTPVVTPQAPPLLGEHGEAVLAGLLGYDAAQIAALREIGRAQV